MLPGRRVVGESDSALGHASDIGTKGSTEDQQFDEALEAEEKV